MSIGTKRLLIVALLSLCVLVLAQTRSSSQNTASSVAAAHAGRYQIFFSPHARADVYLLDTDTGKIWHPVTFTDVDGKPEVWVPSDKIDNQQDRQVWSVQHPSTKPAAQQPNQ